MSEGNSNENQSNSIKLEERSEEQSKSEGPSRKRVHKKQDISNFIMKTYKILEDKRNSHIIQWTDNGTCFIVKHKDLFENQILPKYFKHKKFSSFVRQLNMYDFHKIRKEKQIPIFKHKFFKMGCHELLHKIKRKSGEDGKQDDPSRAVISLNQISFKNQELPMRSAISIRSKATLNGVVDDIDELIRENNELKNVISDMNAQIEGLEFVKSKKQQKLIKILSALIYFNLQDPSQNAIQGSSIRWLQNHFSNNVEDPLSFSQYTQHLAGIYKKLQAQIKLENS